MNRDVALCGKGQRLHTDHGAALIWEWEWEWECYDVTKDIGCQRGIHAHTYMGGQKT